MRAIRGRYMNLKEFVNPSKKYRPTPIWSWNSTIEASEVETRVREMKRKGFGGFFIHPGTGLRTQYMEDDWMRAIRRAVETAREVELECWLCDDDREPSGYGAGKTTENADAYCAMALTWFEDAAGAVTDPLGDAVAYVRKKDDGSYETTTEKPDDITGFGVFVEHRLPRGIARFNGEQYSDLLSEDAVKEFLENTHERYSKLFRYDFGEYMPGIMTMGPTVERSRTFPGGCPDEGVSFPWSAGFADFFRETFGYPPQENLHHLLSASDEGFTFRYDYLLAVNELFILSYTTTVATWCRDHDFKLASLFPGDDPAYAAATTGSVMSHNEYMDLPGITGAVSKDLHARQAKLASSVANQLDRERSLAMLRPETGHATTFEDMKCSADVLFAQGITHIMPSATPYSMKGEGKRSLSPALSYHQPCWEHMRVINDYLARCSWAVSAGRSAARVLVMLPFGSACGAYDASAVSRGDNQDAIDSSYRDIVDELTSEHISFDIGDERIVKRHGSAEGDTLKVGKADYDTVILPRSATWRSSTLDILESFNGHVVITGEIPGRIDGVANDRMTGFAARTNVEIMDDDARSIAARIAETSGRDASVTDSAGNEIGTILVNHRIEAGAHVLFLANTDPAETHEVTLTVRALGGVVELDALSGRAFRYASSLDGGMTRIATTLHPSGSRVFLIDQTQTSIALEAPQSSEENLTISGPYSFRRNQDNTLVLDRCTLTMDNKTFLENASPGAAKRIIRERTGIDEYVGFQPWVMEKRNVRTRTNRTMLTYTFEVRDVPESLSLAVESAEAFTIKVNGVKVEPTPGKWYLDKRITVIDIEEQATAGTNTVTLETDYLWDTEIENIHLFGDFAVGPESEGFPIIKEPETLDTGSWTDQGYPFYSGTMTYTMEFDLDFDETEFFELDMKDTKGGNIFVTVNGTEIGSLPFHPFRAEITAALLKGKNSIEVEVAGTLRNTIGPFHHPSGEESDINDAEQFEVPEEASAHTFAPYGFIEPPKLVRIREGLKEEKPEE